MATIGEQIKAARKAKGMTQEELAEATHMTRTGISKWETDDRRPDPKMMEKLTELLECEFEIPEGAENIPEETGEQADEAVAASGVQGEEAERGTSGRPGTKKNGKQKRIILGCIIAAVLVITGVVLALTLKPAPEEKPQEIVYTDGSGKVYDPTDYKAVTPNEAGKAYISLETKLTIQQQSYGEHFMYDFIMKEENGIGFHIDRMDHITFFYNGTISVDTLTAEDVESWGDDPRIPPYGTYSITCGVNGRTTDTGVPNAAAAALFLAGTDDNGEQLSFTVYLPLPLND